MTKDELIDAISDSFSNGSGYANRTYRGLAEIRSSFLSLPTAEVPYYVGAIMVAFLKEKASDEYVDDLNRFIRNLDVEPEDDYDADLDSLISHKKEHFSSLSLEHRSLVCRFVEWCVADPGISKIDPWFSSNTTSVKRYWAN